MLRSVTFLKCEEALVGAAGRLYMLLFLCRRRKEIQAHITVDIAITAINRLLENTRVPSIDIIGVISKPSWVTVGKAIRSSQILGTS